MMSDDHPTGYIDLTKPEPNQGFGAGAAAGNTSAASEPPAVPVNALGHAAAATDATGTAAAASGNNTADNGAPHAPDFVLASTEEASTVMPSADSRAPHTDHPETATPAAPASQPNSSNAASTANANGGRPRGFNMDALPDLRENAESDPATEKSRAEFTTVYDVIDELDAMLAEAKTSIFTPGMVRVDRDEFTAQLDELKKLLPVQLERASALMREAERRLESAQSQANAVVASAQSRAADMIKDANEQAQFLAGQENVTELARQKARMILEQAQNKSDHLTQGADQYCITVMEGLSQQLTKLNHDVQAGLNVLHERQQAAAEDMPNITLNDYPEAQ